MNCEWSVHVSEKDGSIISLRLNEDINAYVCHPQYAFSLAVSVSLRQANELGLPDEEEKNILGELEAVFIEQLVDNMLCVFAAAVTAEGIREFIFYTYAPQQCEKILRILNETWMHHDIQYVLKEDPNWDVFEDALI